MGNELFDRNAILGAQQQDFDKVIRGYDPKQVDEYIANLLNSSKRAGELFDQRYEELKNQKEMLEYELNQAKGDVVEITKLFETARTQRDELKQQAQQVVETVQVDNEELEEMKQKYNSTLNKNKLLAEENRKLEEKNRALQRDVAHLTKKVDKNRNEIKTLKSEAEAGMSDVTERKYAEVAQIYQSAIDRAEDLIYRLQTELSLAHSKAEDVTGE